MTCRQNIKNLEENWAWVGSVFNGLRLGKPHAVHSFGSEYSFQSCVSLRELTSYNRLGKESYFHQRELHNSRRSARQVR